MHHNCNIMIDRSEQSTLRLSHAKFGVCQALGSSIIAGADYLSFGFANGIVHLPAGRANVITVAPLVKDENGIERSPRLSRLGLDAEVGADTDLTLPPRKDADEDAGVELIIGEIAA